MWSENGDDGEEIKSAKALERLGVELAEAGNVEKALAQFEKAIEIAPKWASAYNNRAQALRLIGRNEGLDDIIMLVTYILDQILFIEAIQNLDKALQFSNGKGKVACQSYCQRAMLLEQSTKEAALKDWESAAKLGSQFARTRLVQLNPYAALCNSMLNDVFSCLNEQGQN